MYSLTTFLDFCDFLLAMCLYTISQIFIKSDKNAAINNEIIHLLAFWPYTAVVYNGILRVKSWRVNVYYHGHCCHEEHREHA